MKKLWKVLAICLVCAVLTMTFVACGDNGDNNGGGGNGGDEIAPGNEWWTTTGELNKNADGSVNFEYVQIDMTSIVTGEDLPALTSIINKFNQVYNGKIKVNLTTANQAEYDNTVSQQIANKTNAPQLLMMHQKSVKAFADNKLLQPFDEALEKSEIDIDLADYSQGLAQHASMGYTDYTFGIPADAQACVVLVNQKMLEHYTNGTGVVPTTRTGLLELLAKVKAGDSTYPATSTAISWSTASDDFFANYVVITSLMQNGLDLYNDSTYRAEWTSTEQQQAFTKGLQAIDGYVDSGYAKYGMNTTQAYDAFYQNKALFLVCMPWNLESLTEEYRTKNSIDASVEPSTYIGATSLAGWFAMDETASTKDIVYGDSHFFAMSKHVTSIEDKAAICEFIRYFTQETSAAIPWGEAGHISAFTPVSTNQAYLSDPTIAAYTSKFYGNINNFRSVGVTPYHQDLTGRIATLFTAVTNGNTDYASLIAKAQSDYNGDVEIGEMGA